MSLNACDNSELKHLAYNTLCSLMNGSIQALIDAMGYEQAFHHLEPHIHLNTQFVNARFPSELGIDTSDMEGLARVILFCNTFSNRGSPSYEVGKESATLYQKSCRTNGQFPNTCEWWCRREWEQIVRDGTPNKSLKQISSLDRGDDLCCWKIEPRSSHEMKDHQVPLPNPEFPMDRLDYWCRAGTAEFWNVASQVMLEIVGEGRGRRLLCKYARMQGEAYGGYCLGIMQSERGRDLLIRSVDQADAMWDVKAEWSKQASDRLERVVHECPFSGATVSPCDQIQAFWQGAASVIAPDWDPVYECCKANGDEKCKMVFSQRESRVVKVPKKDEVLTDPLKALKLRFVKGEISKEEYREMKDIIQEN